MRIIDIKWTPKVNIFIIKCTLCNTEFIFPMNRFRWYCPQCNYMIKIEDIRELYLRRGIEYDNC
jgi:Zn finger protein HypA/HybF involved in hydrogenase expression